MTVRDITEIKQSIRSLEQRFADISTLLASLELHATEQIKEIMKQGEEASALRKFEIAYTLLTTIEKKDIDGKLAAIREVAGKL